MSKNFGLPYMGSKNRIAKELITELIWNEPNAQIFIDLFAGGCAMSHAAILSGKYKKDYSKWLLTDIKYSSSSLQRLERLQRLENLSDILETSQGSYQDFKLPKSDECVIYCDIPYKGTQTYKHDGEKLEFDYEAFYQWARDKAKDGYKIYISEYQMPSDFKEVLTIDTKSLLNDKGQKAVKEKLFKYEN